VAGSGMTKKELLHLRRERDKLDRSLGGIKDMARTPSALWVVDTKKEHIAVSEARKLGIPVIAILDTNCDPDEVTYPIPGNDDAIRSVSLLTRVVADAVADGLMARAGAANGEDKPAAPGESGELGTEEPLAEWERELLEHQASAAGAAPAAAAGGAATADATAGDATAGDAAGADATAGNGAGADATAGDAAGADATAGNGAGADATAGDAAGADATASNGAGAGPEAPAGEAATEQAGDAGDAVPDAAQDGTPGAA
ncbi:MAG TPA: 30S ribosomal protein S2, partial [Streptosporangiaceae bacterium]|nr:30S ribosomal protein S2 [Streptosporangiaceae bacterium]